jgi:UDP-glucose 4-epimerase
MRVLVTGGAGFIGAWIVKRLVDAGLTPVIFDLVDSRRLIATIAGEETARSVTFHTGDIADTDTVLRAAEGCGAIIHLAGLLTPACRADPVKGAQVNLIGTLNVFLAARAQRMPKVLYMSSAGVFGPDDAETPRPTTLYGAFKLGGEFSAKAFYADDGIASVGFRPFVVYGPGREGGLSAGPSLACRAAAWGESYTIPFTGEFDMIHVDDVAAAFMTALGAPIDGARVLNLLGAQTDDQAVIAAIRAAEPKAQITASGPPMPVVTPSPDPNVAVLLPGWTPRPLAQGVAETIDFYRRTPR